MDVSLIVPAKKFDNYLYQLINEFYEKRHKKIELIVVVDQLKPDYLNKKINAKFKKRSNIKFFKSNKKSRIAALNHGYSHSEGKIIKCIDSDDKLHDSFFKYINKLKKFDAHCHNASIGNENLQKIVSYTFNPAILKKEKNYLIENMISSPRWAWSFNKSIAKKIFPIPENLFAEDFWFTFIIKSHARSIYHINEDLYTYRQHNENEWGGVINFSKEIMTQRSKWLINEIDELKKLNKQLGVTVEVFSKSYIYHKALLQRKSISQIILLKISIIYRLKLILIIYFPKIASKIIKLKWLIDRMRLIVL